MSYLVVVKEADHAFLKDAVVTRMNGGRGRALGLREGDPTRQFHYVNQVLLTQSNPD
jgi:hypothetical protein